MIMDMQVKALDILTQKGQFSPEAARAIGEAIDLEVGRRQEPLATKEDLNKVEVALKSDLKTFEVAFKSDLVEVKAEVKSAIAEAKTELARWVFGAAIGQFVILLGILLQVIRH